MPITLKAICFVAAVVLLTWDAVRKYKAERVSFHQSAGLALFVLPFAWDAAELAFDD